MFNVGDKVKTNEGTFGYVMSVQGCLVHVVDNFSDESKPCLTVGKFHETKVEAI